MDSGPQGSGDQLDPSKDPLNPSNDPLDPSQHSLDVSNAGDGNMTTPRSPSPRKRHYDMMMEDGDEVNPEFSKRAKDTPHGEQPKDYYVAYEANVRANVPPWLPKQEVESWVKQNMEYKYLWDIRDAQVKELEECMAHNDSLVERLNTEQSKTEALHQAQQENERLQQMLKKLEAAGSQLQQKFDNLNATGPNAEFEQLKIPVSGWKKKASDLNQDRDAMAAALKESRARVESLQEESKDMDKRVNAQTQDIKTKWLLEVDSLKKARDYAQRKLEKAKKDFDDREDENWSLRNKYKTAQEKYESAVADTQALGKTYNDSVKLIHSLQNQCDFLVKDRDERKNDFDELEATVLKLGNEYGGLEKKYNELLGEHNNLISQFHDMEKQKTHFSLQAQAHMQLCDNLKAQVAMLEAARERSSEHGQQSSQEVQQLQGQLINLRRTHELELETMNNHMSEQGRRPSQEIQSLQTHIAFLEKAHKTELAAIENRPTEHEMQPSQEVLDLQTRIKDLEQAHQKDQQEAQDMQTRIKDLEQAHQRDQRELGEVQGKCDKLETQNIDDEWQKQAMQEEMADLKKVSTEKQAALEAEVAKARSDLAMTQTQLSDTHTELGKTRFELSSSQLILTNGRNQYQKLQGEYENLRTSSTNQYQKLEGEFKTLDASSTMTAVQLALIQIERVKLNDELLAIQGRCSELETALKAKGGNLEVTSAKPDTPQTELHDSKESSDKECADAEVNQVKTADELKALQDRIGDLERTLTAKEAQLAETQAKLSSTGTGSNDITKGSEKKLSDMESELSTARTALEAVSNRFNSVEKKLDEVEKAKRELEDSHKKLQGKLAATQTQLTDSKKGFEKKLSESIEAVTTSRTALQDMTNQYNSTEKKLSNMEHDWKTARTALDNTTKQHSTNDAKLKAAEKAKRKTEESLKNLQDSFSHLEIDHKDLLSNHSKMQAKLDQAVYKSSARKHKADVNEKHIKAADDEVTKLDKECKTLKTEIDKLERMLGGCRDELTKSKSDNDALSEKSQELLIRIENLEKETKEARNLADDRQAMSNEFQADNEAWQEANRDLRKQLDDVNAEFAKISDHWAKLKDDLHSLGHAYTDKNRQYEALSAKYQDVASKYNDLRHKSRDSMNRKESTAAANKETAECASEAGSQAGDGADRDGEGSATLSDEIRSASPSMAEEGVESRGYTDAIPQPNYGDSKDQKLTDEGNNTKAMPAAEDKTPMDKGVAEEVPPAGSNAFEEDFVKGNIHAEDIPPLGDDALFVSQYTGGARSPTDGVAISPHSPAPPLIAPSSASSETPRSWTAAIITLLIILITLFINVVVIAQYMGDLGIEAEIRGGTEMGRLILLSQRMGGGTGMRWPWWLEWLFDDGLVMSIGGLYR